MLDGLLIAENKLRVETLLSREYLDKTLYRIQIHRSSVHGTYLDDLSSGLGASLLPSSGAEGGVSGTGSATGGRWG